MHSGRPGSNESRRPSLFNAPSARALLIQVFSFAIVLASSVALPALTGAQLGLASAAILQGVIAALVSRLSGMAPWWLFIQFLFPVAAIALDALALPPWIYLVAFLALLGLYWTTFRTQVPYYPSTQSAWDAVDKLLPQGRPTRFIDIGSGFGGLVMHLAARRPESDFIGIEVAPVPWLVSALRARLGHSRSRFVPGDYGRLDFAGYDVVFAYLSPAAMPALWDKARAEMRRGALLLSYEFPVPGVAPDLVEHPDGDGPPLYGWFL